MMEEKVKGTVEADLQKNLEYMNQILPVKDSFDLIQRDICVGERKSSFFFIDGLTKDEVMQKIMTSLFGIKKEDMPESVEEFIQAVLPYIEVDQLKNYDDIIRNLLSGVTCLFVDGYDACIAIDCRTYPSRSVEEPEKDKSLRGSRDGFLETVVFNTALIRRRIRDPHLVMKMFDVGEKTRTDVVVCYMEDRVDQRLLEHLVEKINQLQVDALRMNQQSLAEALYQRRWFNPFPKFKFTERPDTAAVCLLEGKVVILVDNSPSAMVLPITMLDMIEEANDYYFPTITNVYLKFSRVLITIATVFLTPVFLLFMQNPGWVPGALDFILIRDVQNLPIIYQMLILELSIDGLRLAALTTPSMLSTPLSVIAGIVMGEFAVESGWFNSEVMLYMSFVAVANYTQPNFELGYALKFMRLLLLILTAGFRVWGFIVGTVLVGCFLFFNRSIAGGNYFAKSSN